MSGQEGGSFERDQFGEEQVEQSFNQKYKDKPSTGYSKIILLVLIFLGIAILNYYFFIQANQDPPLVHSTNTQETHPQNTEIRQRQIEAKLKIIEDSEANIMTKINQINIKIDAPDNSPKQHKQIEMSIQKLTKQITQLAKQIAQSNQKIQSLSPPSKTQQNQNTPQKQPKDSAQLIKEKQEKKKPIQEVIKQPMKEATKQEQAIKEIKQQKKPMQKQEQQKIENSPQHLVEPKSSFDIPKKLWIFREGSGNYLNELCFNNNINFAKQSKFDFVEISRQNYMKYLPQKIVEDVERAIKLVKDKASIIRNIIILNVLNQNGGLITNAEFAFTENLDWLRQIKSNPYVNRGDREANPQVFGYYSVEHSLAKSKQNIKPFKGMEEVDQLMLAFPVLENYFIAAYQKTPFLAQLISTIYNLLEHPNDFRAKRSNYKLSKIIGEDIYSQYFFIASQIVLQDKQRQMDSSPSPDGYRHFAIDHYGLNLMNNFYGPYKFKLIWYNDYRHQPIQCLSQYTIEELYANIGPIKYIAKLTPTEEVNVALEEARDGRRRLTTEGSFIHKIFYSHAKVNFTRKNEQRPFVKSNNVQWTALPKIIWLFWDNGLANTKSNNKLCVQNLKRMGGLSGFKVTEVNSSNVAQYLDENTLKKIQNSINRAQLSTFPTTRSDLTRLALVHKYGGIYMDSSYVALQSFDWLINIGRYPSEYIFNRYGDLPKVFLIWHPYDGSPREWTISKKYNTKSQWHLGYENSFIAAEKESALIKDWFQLLLQFYVHPYSQLQKIFQDCKIYDRRWSKTYQHYLIPMDAVKCAIGRKQVMIQNDPNSQWESASDYYRVWSMSGYLGQQKFAWNTNYQRPGNFNTPGIHDNVFVYRHSQEYSQGLVGKVRHLVKFFSRNNEQMSNLINRHADGQFSSEVHSQSIFMRYMWKPYKLSGKALL